MDPACAGCPAGPPGDEHRRRSGTLPDGRSLPAGGRIATDRARGDLPAVDGDRLDAVGGRELEAEDLPVERQLGVERAADVGGLAEAVLLALERRRRPRARRRSRSASTIISDWPAGRPRPPGPAARSAAGRSRRGDGSVSARRRRRAVGVRPDEPVEVAALELVRVAGERLEVGDAVVAGARRRTCRRKASAASVVKPPAEPPRMHRRSGSTRPSVGQPAGRGLAVLDVDDTPRVARAGRGRHGRSRWSRGS